MDERAKRQPPGDHKRVLLHSRRAPCPGEVMEAMPARCMIEIGKREGFYQQESCGCAHSLRDTNKRRRRSPSARNSTAGATKPDLRCLRIL